VGVTLVPGQPLEVGWEDCAACGQLDWELTLLRGTSSACAVLLPPQVSGGQRGGALVFDWETRQLQLVHSTDWGVLEAAAGVPLPAVPHKLLLDQADQSTDSLEAALTAVDQQVDHQPQQPVLPVEQLTLSAAAEARDAVSANTTSSTSQGPAPASEQQGQQQQLPKRCGGVLRASGGLCPSLPPPQQRLSLRLLLDGSLVEVFTAEGEALASRVYRHAVLPETVPPEAVPQVPAAPQGTTPTPSTTGSTNSSNNAKVGGFWVGSFGGSAQLAACSMWHMESCWEEEGGDLLQQLPVAGSVPGGSFRAAAAGGMEAVSAGASGAAHHQQQLLPVEALLAASMEAATASAVGAAAVVGASAAVAAAAAAAVTAGGLVTPLVTVPVTGGPSGEGVTVGGGSGRASPLVSPRPVTPVEGGH
jgi:hypothetical protein